ncbi:TRAFs-binding domain-containing protein [Novosphingobium sp. BL-8H]|uniref:TRAFs-binding domain-containing protein n=1 Tax=Novosphingobium sp. BL-8H TaxID=3127640 RepID=UPI003757056B
MTLPLLARIRQIARSGDVLRAWRLFEGAGLLESRDSEALSLKGRLLKDRGLRSLGPDRSELLDQAQDAYMRAAGGRRATYPLINAATIALLNGKPDEAQALARQVLDLLESGDYEPETRYWLGATAAEAELLLGDARAARLALEEAVKAAPDAWEDQAATLRQFQQILEWTGAPFGVFDHLRPPASLYFSGIIGLPEDADRVRQEVASMLDRVRPGVVFGALAAGSDILIAEMAIAAGAQLHVVLPTHVEAFREISVAHFGEDWGDRFDRLLDAADVIDILEGPGRLSGAAVHLAAQVAMGLAIRRARVLATEALAFHVGRAFDELSPPEVEWRRQGRMLHELVLDESLPARGADFDPAVNRAVLAIAGTVPPVCDLTFVTRQTVFEGFSLLQFDDPVAAMDQAAALLRVAPESRLGLDYRPVCPEKGLVEIAEPAIVLARSANEGSVCAHWPQIAVLELLAPRYRFETAGEVVTPLGDFPIGLFCQDTQG